MNRLNGLALAAALTFGACTQEETNPSSRSTEESLLFAEKTTLKPEIAELQEQQFAIVTEALGGLAVEPSNEFIKGFVAGITGACQAERYSTAAGIVMEEGLTETEMRDRSNGFVAGTVYVDDPLSKLNCAAWIAAFQLDQ